jgi:hypothetical protein
VAAVTGPTPKTSVTVVPAAWTAAVTFFLASRIRMSICRKSSAKSPASSQRAAATASDGAIAPSPCRCNVAIRCRSSGDR